jgi:hypothetical protein
MTTITHLEHMDFDEPQPGPNGSVLEGPHTRVSWGVPERGVLSCYFSGYHRREDFLVSPEGPALRDTGVSAPEAHP